MRTDIRIVLVLVNPALTTTAPEGSRVIAMSQVQAMLNTWITQGVLIKYKVGPCNDHLLFEIIRTK
jgi:hypothetical protein